MGAAWFMGLGLTSELNPLLPMAFSQLVIAGLNHQTLSLLINLNYFLFGTLLPALGLVLLLRGALRDPALAARGESGS